jgi:dTDP-glucose 4,6-dehydratase/UDP-glucose 4-epimerase
MTHPFRNQIEDILERSPDLWLALAGKSVFLTGGTGFSGRWLLETLVRARQRFGIGVDVTVLTRNTQAYIEKAPHIATAPGIVLQQGDIQTFDFPDRTFSYVIHAAATSAKETFDGEDPLNKFDMASVGARRVLDLAVRCGAERVLIVGSGSVYGGVSADLGALSETYLGAPSTLDTVAGLGHGKRAAEFQAACYADKYGLSVSIARCFTFVGAYLPLNIHYAIGNFIRDALHAEAISVQGDGTALRSYLFAGDLITWLLTLLLRGATRKVYNVGSDQAISIGDLAALVRDVIAPEKPVRILGQASGQPRSIYVPDISCARSDLNLDVWTPLPEAIRRTAEVAKIEEWGD